MDERRRWARVALGAAFLLGACGGPSRFALRAPLLHDSDDRPFAPAPSEDEEPEVTNAVDAIILLPLANAFVFNTWGEAHNVNALDEVPDSSWFTNRSVEPEDLVRGPCPDEGPTPPFIVLRAKSRGDTPGFVVEDATGQRYVLKLDPPVPTQPEISTAADAIVSRLYWAVGFNAPCNDVINVRSEDFVIDERSTEEARFAGRRPLVRSRLESALARATRGPDGTLRMAASRFIEGRPVGTWREHGTRGDDPNDVISHEDRRELRGERFLAAWVSHWDSRGPNTFDSYVEAEGGGYIQHYFLDFGDCLGTTPSRNDYPEPRVGHSSILNLPNIAADAVTFGFVRRPWDELEADPRYPNLGFFGVEHFEPMSFAPQTPLIRWERAQPADFAWMARRMARLGVEHVRAAVQSGRFTDPAEAERLVEVLMGRRDQILRASFVERSPLANLEMVSPGRLCATDVGITSGVSDASDVSYVTRAHEGAALRRSSHPTASQRTDDARVCVQLPPSFARAGSPDDSAERYATLDIGRNEGDRLTVIRAHFYELGPTRGYVLVGIERP